MAQQAKQAMGTEERTVLADKGYFGGTEILACEQERIAPLVLMALDQTAHQLRSAEQ